MKMRSDCILTQLTEAQREEIFDSLAAGESYRSLQKRCALPFPEGFGILIHLGTLTRFYKAERRRRHAEELAEFKFDEIASENPEALYENIKVELAHACYDLAHQPDNTHVNVLARILNRLELVRLDQQRLSLEQQRVSIEDRLLAEKVRQFNFNAAREAAKYALEIKDTLARKDIDLEDKVWKISERVFGPPPNPQNSQ